MFKQLVLTSYGTANLELSIGDDVAIQIVLSEQEQDTIKSMCERFYSERRISIVDMASNYPPALADFSEVEPPDVPV